MFQRPVRKSKDIVMKKIPSKYQVGGATIEVRIVDRCEDNSIGIAKVCAGYIEIANKYNKDDVQSDECKVNTFYHEMTHTILDTMGYNELSQDEKFVSSFSSFLTEAMRNAKFKED